MINWVNGGGPTTAGVRVSKTTAMSFDAVYSCVKIIAETCAILPRHVVKVLDRGKERLVGHPVARLIAINPNPDMTAQTYWETIVGHAALGGDGYAQILKSGNPRGYPTQLRLLDPDRMTVERENHTETGRILYQYQPQGVAKVTLLEDQVFHLTGFGNDGLNGFSPIEFHRQTIGAALANIEHSGSFYGRGAMPSGVLEYEGHFKDKQKMQEFLKEWNDNHQGSGNAYGTALLQQGITYKPMTMSARDAQTVEMFKLNVRQIARIYRMPLHKIADMDAATNNNIEQEAIEFVQDTIMPWLERIAQEIKRKLFLPGDDALFVEHVIEKLLRADIETRYKAYALALQNGFKTPNEVRALEDDNPKPGGDDLIVQAQMEPLDQISEEKDPGQNINVDSGGNGGSDDDDDDDRMALLAESYRGLFEDAYGRIVRVETDRLRAAAKREADFGGWLERFYADQKRHVRSVMDSIVRSAGSGLLVAKTGRPASGEAMDQLEAYASELADRHTQLGYSATSQASSRGGDVLAAVEAVCAGWSDRAARLAEQEVRLLSAAVAKLVELN